MKKILVSVITPCYNSEKTIERTLQSIINQSYQHIEYIIIDGGSTDRTLEIIKKYESKLPDQFILVSEKDHGIYDAMNKGILRASGEIIGIVNSDDWYENNTIETILQYYKSGSYQVIYGMQRNMVYDKEKSVVLHSHYFLQDQMITHPTCFVSKNIYEKFGTFSTTYKSAADYEFMLRLYDSNIVEFTPIYQVLSNFQLGGMSGSQVGVRENIQIRYERNLVTRKRYLFVMIKSFLYEILSKRKKS